MLKQESMQLKKELAFIKLELKKIKKLKNYFFWYYFSMSKNLNFSLIFFFCFCTFIM